MSGWGLRLNPWGSSYSSLEADQMRFIHKAYCEAMEVGEEDLPIQLKMDDSFYPTYRPNTSDFDENTFMRKMQDVVGLLRNPAEAIISTICAYQRERHDRSFSFTGYLNDPRTLLLEEFKDWAMRTLAPASCTTESILNEVRRRHSYVLRLQHGQQGLLHSGSGERSLMGTLKDVRSVIENRILPTIEAERAHSSAREQLHTLEARGTDGLMHGVQFLFYVFRNTPNTPADCTISNLQSQQHAGMKDAMQSKSGQMLQVLLTTPSFKSLFPEAPSANAKEGEQLRALQLTAEEQKEMETTAVFCDDNAKALVPTVLTRSHRNNASKDSTELAIAPADFLGQSGSGVVQLRTESAVQAYDAFTRLHGLLKLLADLLVSCRKARQLAGPGGDLLVYGPGGEEVRRLMNSLETVQAEIGRVVSKLTRMGVRELDRLKPNQEKAWRWSFSKVLPLENYLAHDFGACVEPIQRIYASADPLHVQKMFKQFRQATGMWVEENSSICRHVSAALGTPFIERKPVEQLESGEQQQQNGSPQIQMLENGSTEESNSALALVPMRVKNGKVMDAKIPNGATKEEPKSDSDRFTVVEDENDSENQNPNNQLVVAGSQALVTRNHQASAQPEVSLLSTAASIMSWAVGAKKTVAERKQLEEAASSPQHSETDEEDEKLHSSASSTTSTGSNNAGVLDVLLLVRQSIQRIGQLSWGVRTSFHTASIDEGDFDAFIVLCSIYQDVSVQCSSDLLVRLRQHRVRLQQLLQRHLGSVLSCIMVLQSRIVDEQKSIPGMNLVYRRMEAIFVDFEKELDALTTDFKQMMVECNKMKNGIQAMPLVHAVESQEGLGPAAYAFNSINALATSIGGSQAPSAAILSHGQYMTQMSSQMDLHWNSISHLVQSLKGTMELVGTVSDRLRDCAKDSRNVVPPQQLDYIFEFNYDGFFRQTTKDLQVLLYSFDAK